jgi:molybdenum cofactor guanylyltransferase
MERSFSQVRLTLSTLILAGGQSRRMGQDKALIEVNGQPLIQRISMVAQTVSDQVFVVTPWGDRYRSLLPSNCRIIPEPFDPKLGSMGPLVGFIQGLSQINSDWCLLLACDLPNLSVPVIRQWCETLPQVPDEAIAFLPQHPKGWEPLCGFYRTRCLASGQTFVEQGGRSFQKWLAQLKVHPLLVDDPSILFNCNTPSDRASIIG